ncbi:hypothetical protein [Thermus scotoductus]|uniref:hypothetical protein n=1 Tax=Thermus scotoductus TaxID=37636 RepID=UPI00068A2F42|nr:hypothetical protein [Thermus scotoductus]
MSAPITKSAAEVKLIRVGESAATGLPCFIYHDPYHERFVNHVRSLVAQNLPVLVRLHPGWNYPAEEDILRKEVDRTGHAVLVVGYDDAAEEFILLDPWDQSRWGGSRGGEWRIGYREFGLFTVDCTKDAVIAGDLPKVEIQFDGVDKLRCNVTYSCPEPLFRTFIAEETFLTLTVPKGMQLNADRNRICLGQLQPGETCSVVIPVTLGYPVNGEITAEIEFVIRSLWLRDWKETVRVASRYRITVIERALV